MFKSIKTLAFWPAFILIGGAIVFNFANEELFISVFTSLNNMFMLKMGWFANIIAVLCLVVCIWAMVSKFGDVRIGGKDAKPKLSNFSWFSISLCSTLAAGLLVWGPAEPIYHIMDPASAITGLEPNTGDAALFTMDTMIMHWSYIPYAIMTTAAVVFAFMYYNGKEKYSISTQLAPILGKHNSEKAGAVLDGLILFCITIAISASLGQMLLNINYGMEYTLGILSDNFTMLVICVILVVAYVGSAVSGLKKGIKLLADVNVYAYFLLLAGILIFGPTFYILNLGTEGFGSFVTHIFERAMMTGAAHETQWPQWWTTFYWASYFAWTPTLGLFLGSISYGRTIRATIGVNFILNATFGLAWVVLISGTAIERQVHGVIDLITVAIERGVGAVPYEMLGSLPLGFPIAVLYLFIIFISFITSANANVSVMAGLASKGVSLEDPTGSPAYQKIIWGILCAAMAYIIGSLIGTDGLKALCNISGIIAVFIEVGIIASVIMLIFNWRKFDRTGTYKEKIYEEI